MSLARDRFENTIVHVTSDPELILAEYDVVVESAQDHHEHAVSDVLVLRIRDGKIGSVRAYTNSLAIAKAMGR